jgi:asparagine synthase (glutamine-hydrolysing)
MTLFALLRDPDRERRARFVRNAREARPAHEGLVWKAAEEGDCAVVAWMSPLAPTSWFSQDGALAVIWGEPLDAAGKLIDASNYAARAEAYAPPSSPLDGLHAAVAVTRDGTVHASADLLGMFPVYWWTRGDATLVASSAEAARWHPLSEPGVDRDGLTSVLLACYQVDGRGLQPDVRRLAAGHRVRLAPNGSTALDAEVSLSDVPAGPYDLPSEARRVGDLLVEAVARQMRPSGEIGLLLSGGRDSRLLAGALMETGHRPAAMTLSAPGDYEAIGAKAVARTLGLTHALFTPDPAIVTRWAGEQVRLAHLATGLNNFHAGALAPALMAHAGRVVTGHMLDTVFMGTLRPDAQFTTEYVLDRQGARGLPPATVAALLGPDGPERVDRIRTRMAETLEGTSQNERWQQVLWYQLVTSERFNLGGIVWDLSFGPWPRLPVLDRALLDVALRLPAALKVNRALHDEILRQRYPKLASLPLVEANAWLGIPTGAGRLARLRAKAEKHPWWGRVLRQPDRRFAYRQADPNGPAWRAIRRAAEAGRELAATVLDRRHLDALVPPPDAPWVTQDGMHDIHGRKQLMAFMLWASTHLT